MCCNNWSGTSVASSTCASVAAAACQNSCSRSCVVGYLPIVATYQVGSPVWTSGSNFATTSGFAETSGYDSYSGSSCCCGY